MKIKVIASTKVGYVLPKEEAIDFSGKSAGICYLPDTVETLFAELPEKTQRRANALQNIIIPRNQSIVKYITDSLEEKDREEFSRLKVIKATRLRAQKQD